MTETERLGDWETEGHRLRDRDRETETETEIESQRVRETQGP